MNWLCTGCEANPDLQPDCRICAGSGEIRGVDWAHNPWDRIAPGLWLGGHDWAGGESTSADLEAAKFDVVISFYRRETCMPAPHVEHHHLRIPDGHLQDEEYAQVRALADLALDRLKEGKKVLIRCQAGLNRSSLCAAMALQRLGFTAREAIDHIRTTRSKDALCNGAFVDYLLREETMSNPITEEAYGEDVSDPNALRDHIVTEEQWDAVPGVERYAAGDGPEAVVGITEPEHLFPLSLNEYQAKAMVTAIYPEKGTGSAMALAYVGLGLGEAGEIQGKIKKLLRDDAGHVSNEKRLAIAQEYGDLLWYVAVGVQELGLDLESVAMFNLEKLASRKERGVITGSGDNR